MLLQFTVGNFLSFNDPVTLSMVASSIKEHENTNLFVENKIKLLKSAAIYGANASGKSNLIKALSFMKKFVFISSKETQATEEIEIANFKLSTETDNKPSFFEIVFINENIIYRYGFEADKKNIQKEWLFQTGSGREAKLFKREKNNFELGSYFKEGEGKENITRNNALFLSVVAQFNGEISKKILEWFAKLKIISGLNEGYSGFTIDKIKEPEFKNKILNFLKIADLGIEDINSTETKISPESLPQNTPEFLKTSALKDELKNVEINTFHKKYNSDKNFLLLEKFDLENEESEGTKKFFAISAPIIDTLMRGYTLIIDELDSRLHPILSQHIINLFNSSQNSLNAQLIFASHDTNLLNKEFLRRDQIWFTEKDKYGATKLYSLVEYKIGLDKVRNDSLYSKNYILGKYGAVPYVGDFKSLFKGKQ
ncbi:MAG: ATP-binding protein [Candidatus Firestonebacteria bacterium]|nr:ATP-binding protein [Candidatus Firestonebacteria bacterium]